MRHIILSLLALVVISANAATVAPTRDDREVSVRVVWYDSKREVVEACKRMGAWPMIPTDMVMRHPAPGCNAWHVDSKLCVIHALRPQRVDDARTTTLGHELLHCFFGNYHD